MIARGFQEEAIPVLEFAVSTHTDISATYRTLASIYYDKQERNKIEHLKEIAESLRSAMRPSILKTLDEFLAK